MSLAGRTLSGNRVGRAAGILVPINSLPFEVGKYDCPCITFKAHRDSKLCQEAIGRIDDTYEQSSPLHPERLLLTPDIGYYNLQMIIFGKSLTVTEGTEAEMATIRECQQKCIESANQAIDLIYDTFRNSDFFQTWYVNFPLFFF